MTIHSHFPAFHAFFTPVTYLVLPYGGRKDAGDPTNKHPRAHPWGRATGLRTVGRDRGEPGMGGGGVRGGGNELSHERRWLLTVQQGAAAHATTTASAARQRSKTGGVF